MVFIGIVGLPFSGRHRAMRILLKEHEFRFISLRYKGYIKVEGSEEYKNSNSLSEEHERFYPKSINIKEFILPEKVFDTSEELIEFVLENYQDKWVTIIGGPATRYANVPTIATIEQEHKLYSLRPFYLAVGVDTTSNIRTSRAMNIHDSNFEYTRIHGASLVNRCYQLASVIVSFGMPELHDKPRAYKSEYFITDEIVSNDCSALDNNYNCYDDELAENIRTEVIQKLSYLLRPPWDVYFIQLCILASHRSNCMKRRVGAVLVSSKSHRIISTGYNGTPLGMKNCNEGGCPRCNDPRTKQGTNLSICICLHAEENVLLEAGRERIQKQIQSRSDSQKYLTKGDHYNENNDSEYAILYCTTCPCISCAKKIIQCGIREVVYLEDYHFDVQVGELFKLAQVKCRRIDSTLFPRKLLT